MTILLPILILAGVGLLAGLILAVASVLMAVPRDEKVEALKELLPGANCGACGYSGCEGYAHAMVHEGAKVGLCSPGGAKVAEATPGRFWVFRAKWRSKPRWCAAGAAWM